jgi:DNA-binding LacI/PurR family transcriptional regulator
VPPTAIVAANDLLALGAINAAIHRNLNVPMDVSVSGFDDVWFADKMNPSITTIRVPMHDMGYTAASLLIKKISGENILQDTVMFDVDLLERGSSGPCRAGLNVR